MGTHLKELSESYPMNTNMTGLDGFQKSLCPCALDKSSLSIGRVNYGDSFLTRAFSKNICGGNVVHNQTHNPP